MNYGKMIRARRTELGLSMEDVSKRADISIRTVYAIEKGMRKPTLTCLEAVLDVLNMKIEIKTK